ncbi:MAG: hypothetical protein H6Q15_126 [Bacteroidetes bacterium]|nr:hypothetical protein [Bacteroidota bacterium]
MKMKKVLLFILLSIGAMSISAQNVLLQNDTIKIVGDSSVYNSSTIVNLDNDGHWANLNGKLVNYDDTLGIIKTINQNDYSYKMDNKFYSVNLESRYVQIPIDSNSWVSGNLLIDSIYLKVVSDSARTFTLPQLYNYSDTSTDFLRYLYTVTPKHNFILANNYKVSDTLNTILCLFDTNGNVIKTSDILYYNRIMDMDCNGKDILLSCYQPSNKNILYIIDADSLNIKDSIDLPSNCNISSINDSLLFMTGYYDLTVYNLKTKEYKTTDILNYSNISVWLTMENRKNKMVNVDNLNNMYIAIYTSYLGRGWEDSPRGIEIINFDVNCNIKNVITYNGYLPTHNKMINGLEVTKDSSLIIVVNSSEDDYYSDTTLNYLMKYSHKTGEVGLTKIQTENYSIYPNPVKDKLQITGNYDRIEIYDNIGRNVYNSNKSSDYDLSKLNSGFYLVKIFEENKTYTKKIIKE